MKKTIFLLVLIFLLANSIIYGKTETSLVNGWVAQDHSFTTKSGNTYSLFVSGADFSVSDPSKSMLQVKKNGELIDFVSYEECETSTFYKVCYNSIDFEHKLAKLDQYGKFQPAVSVNITEFDYGDDISIVKTVDLNEVNEGKNTRVKILIRNTGEIDLVNVKLNEVLGEGFSAFKYSEGFENLEITFDVLRVNATEELFYYVTAGNSTGTFVTKIIYDTQYFKNRKAEEKNISISVVPKVVAVSDANSNEDNSSTENSYSENTNTTSSGMVKNTGGTKVDQNMNFWQKLVALIKSFF
ncbi:MAG: hypothetical protein PHU51_05305 [Candidatus Nanoarchaeia archaeon]|nr:hypothetical protein [Candidatus Nanoarchaeia archaeon]